MVKSKAIVVSNKRSNFLDISMESIKLLFENRKLIIVTIVTTLSILFHCLLLISTISSAKPMFQLLLGKEDVSLYSLKHLSERSLARLRTKSSLSLASFAILLLAMVLEPTAANHGKTFTSALPLRLTFMRLAFVYLLLANFSTTAIDLVINGADPPFPGFVVIIQSAISFCVLVLGCLSVYVYVVWDLALDSFWDESSGSKVTVSALRKAQSIVEGTGRINWFAMNFSVALSRVIFVHFLIGRNKSRLPGEMIVGFLLTVCSCGTALLQHLSYILGCFKRKKMMHGDYVELEGGLAYCKIIHHTTPQ